jgi:hypothetical protein
VRDYFLAEVRRAFAAASVAGFGGDFAAAVAARLTFAAGVDAGAGAVRHGGRCRPLDLRRRRFPAGALRTLAALRRAALPQSSSAAAAPSEETPARVFLASRLFLEQRERVLERQRIDLSRSGSVALASPCFT